MRAVIMAGGKGTRIASLISDIPKPMVPIGDKPILEHQIICLKKQGIEQIILVIGYLGYHIKNYFGDGTKWGVQITYYEEMTPLGTAGALYFLKDFLKEDFLLLNGDIIFDIDIQRLIRYHQTKKGLVTLVTHPNNHPYDSGIIIADADKRVQNWLHKEEERTVYKNRVNAGIHILSPTIIDTINKDTKTDLDRDVLKPLIKRGSIFVYDTPEYIKDMGTPERYKTVTRDYIEGKIQAKNLNKKQKAVFLDRDGTINVYKGFIHHPEEIVLIEGVAQAIQKINEKGYLAIVVTNQPVIARGECSYETLKHMHNRLETLLGEKGAYIDDIFFCPHHPDKGFKGEVVELKKECSCRKPKPGMLLQAAKKYNIDLQSSYMIGDDRRDILAGIAAGCTSILISNKEEDFGQAKTFSSLRCCIDQLLV